MTSKAQEAETGAQAKPEPPLIPVGGGDLREALEARLVESLTTVFANLESSVPYSVIAERVAAETVDALSALPAPVVGDAAPLLAVSAGADFEPEGYPKGFAEWQFMVPYDVGKDDGYSKAIQEIDLATGGDGEYRYCIGGDPERHCPDAAAMKARILARFAALPAPVVGEDPRTIIVRILEGDTPDILSDTDGGGFINNAHEVAVRILQALSPAPMGEGKQGLSSVASLPVMTADEPATPSDGGAS